MQTRSKVVELSGHKFQLRKLQPDVGSYIFMRMMGVQMRTAAAAQEARQDQPKKEQTQEVEAPSMKISGEEQVRALTFLVCSGGMEFKDFKFIQNEAMRVISIIDTKASGAAGMELPMPIMTDTGAWTPQGEEVSGDIGLVMQLTTEVMVHCFADFFDKGGLGS